MWHISTVVFACHTQGSAVSSQAPLLPKVTSLLTIFFFFLPGFATFLSQRGIHWRNEFTLPPNLENWDTEFSTSETNRNVLEAVCSLTFKKREKVFEWWWFNRNSILRHRPAGKNLPRLESSGEDLGFAFQRGKQFFKWQTVKNSAS